MQLAAQLPRPVVPTELVIEHWPKDEVTIAGIAPKDVELGRAWRTVGPRWQVDLQHPRKPSGAGVPGCPCRPHRSAGANSNQEQLGQCQQDLPGASKNLRPR